MRAGAAMVIGLFTLGLAAEGHDGGAAPPPEKVIALVAFPDLTLLDLVGPLQVLKSLPAPYRVIVVGAGREAVSTDSGLAVTPERTFAEVPQPFAIVVPGGPGSVAAMANPALQSYLRSAAPSSGRATCARGGSRTGSSSPPAASRPASTWRSLSPRG